MKKETYLPILMLLLLPGCVTAQTNKVKISFNSPPSAVTVYQLPNASADTLLVRVPKAYGPGVENPGSLTVSRWADGDSFVFSFIIPAKTTPRVRAVRDGIELSFLAESAVSQHAVLGQLVTEEPAQAPEQAPVPGLDSESLDVPTAVPSIPHNEVTPRPSSTQPNAVNTVQDAGQNDQQKKAVTEFEKEKINTASVDFNVPESPGFTILGLNPQAVIRPTSPRQFVTSLLNGVDANGNFQTGVALDTTPYLLFFGKDRTIGDYRNSYVERLLARTQLSLATTKGASEADKSARLGLGMHVTLYDAADPRLDQQLQKCFTAAFIEIKSKITRLNVSQEEVLQLEQQLKNLGDACRKSWRETSLGKTSWVVGAAGSWLSTAGATKDLMWSGGAVWTSLAYGFERTGLADKAQFIAHFRHRTQEMVPEPKMAGKFFERDATLAGARFRFGKPVFAGNAEYVFTHEKRKDMKLADDNHRFSFGAERKIAENLYFSLSVGGETQRRDGSNNKVFVLTAFKWGTSNQPTLPAN